MSCHSVCLPSHGNASRFQKQLASLNVEEFDLRLDEGMVRWAQGLADRVMWNLVADRRADEMDTWPLPDEAFCSSQVIIVVVIDSTTARTGQSW